jgi:colanic acid/amylovoran biosynthesis glycosyltransferase
MRDTPWRISAGELRRLLAVLDQQKAELLHVYFGHIAVHLLPLVTQWARPTVVSFHGADVMVDMHKPAYRSATREVLEKASLVLARSQSLGKALIQLGCPSDKLRIQRTGIPTADLPFRQRCWPSATGEWRLLQACRLVEKKGLATSLRAFAQFHREFPKSKLTIAGEGPLHETLLALAKDLEIADTVHFAGFLSQSELRQLYYESHIFLQPSETGPDGNQEGVPNAMLEAMATGLAVFATSHGGIPEAVRDGENGVLVNERDTKGLACRLTKMASQPQMLEALARSAAETVRREFDQQEQTAKLEDIYLKLINRRSDHAYE